jgi:cystathionine gamma-synthase
MVILMSSQALWRFKDKGPLWQLLKTYRHDTGAVLAPFESWLLLRGMRTLHIRVRAASSGALTLARQLQSHPMIEQVRYPGLQDAPDHSLAKRQMDGGFGGMLSIQVKGGEQAAIGAAAKVKIWKRATSLGGVESLIEHRSSIEGLRSACSNEPCCVCPLELKTRQTSTQTLIKRLARRCLRGHKESLKLSVHSMSQGS